MVDVITTGNELATNLDTRQTIAKIEGHLTKCPDAIFGDAEICPLTHSFADGCYVREIFIPAGMLLTGKIHRHSHPNFLMKGKVAVLTESGGLENIEAPCYMISPAGTKRAVYTHTDCVWITVHVTDKQNLEEIEEEIIAPSYDDEGLNAKQIEALERLCLG